jgi:hypothetical protein
MASIFESNLKNKKEFCHICERKVKALRNSANRNDSHFLHFYSEEKNQILPIFTKCNSERLKKFILTSFSLSISTVSFLGFGIWHLAFDIWHLAFGICHFSFGICHL